MASVKWLTSIDARRESFAGFQQAVAYRHQRDEDDPGLPFNRIRVRAVMVPPGIPDFFTRRRVVDRRRVEPVRSRVVGEWFERTCRSAGNPVTVRW
jgi:hypothetical protein